MFGLMATQNIQHQSSILQPSLRGVVQFPAFSKRKRISYPACAEHGSEASTESENGNRQDQSTAARVPAAFLTPSRASSAIDLKLALGIDKDDARLGSNRAASERRSPGKERKPERNVFMERLQQSADSLRDFTEGDFFQVRGLQFLISLFPIWVLYLLVAAGAIQLPFPLPFLDN